MRKESLLNSSVVLNGKKGHLLGRFEEVTVSYTMYLFG